MDLLQLKFPIGKYVPIAKPEPALIDQWLRDIRDFPMNLTDLLQNCERPALNWPYRPGGWNIREVVHHCADSHMNAIIRFKLALTEDLPTIKPYYEDRWARLADYQEQDLSVSLALISAIHHRWVNLLEGLDSADLDRAYYHPEHNRQISLAEALGNYSWHGRHHYAHIKNALASGGSFL